MSRPGLRSVKVQAFAKINLDLRVLYRRPDGFHELRTVFQTISLADQLGIQFEPADRVEIEIAGVDIPGNLVETAARRCLDALGTGGILHFTLRKRIPMGAGLGGGSSDAAAVLLALPALAGRELPWATVAAIAKDLGSDVPFFLMGGAAAGLGRGEELYPLPDRYGRGLLVTPGIHVSTPEAYQALSATLSAAQAEQKLVEFQQFATANEPLAGKNDFETVVFARHPKLELIKSQLLDAGADAALMSGSGSSIFGLFAGREQVLQAGTHFREEKTIPFSLVSRARFRSVWRKRLAPFITPHPWPPRPRFVQ